MSASTARSSCCAPGATAARRIRSLRFRGGPTAIGILSPRGANEAGRWRTSRTPYLREIMDALSPVHPAQRILVMTGANSAVGLESWLVDHVVINGGPERAEAWTTLTELLGETWPHPSGAFIGLAKLAVDTGYESPAARHHPQAGGCTSMQRNGDSSPSRHAVGPHR